jgi:hypothetical protein
MYDPDILVMHLADESLKIGEFVSVDIEIVEACAPPRIDVNRAYCNISVLIAFDHVGHILLVLVPSVQPDPVIVRPFGVGGTLEVVSWRDEVLVLLLLLFREGYEASKCKACCKK